MARHRKDPRVSIAFGCNLADARDNAGCSLAALAELTGISKSTLSHYEKGHNSPSLENIIELERVLSLRAGELVPSVEQVEFVKLP